MGLPAGRGRAGHHLPLGDDMVAAAAAAGRSRATGRSLHPHTIERSPSATCLQAWVGLSDPPVRSDMPRSDTRS